ncbi:RagB/SusD family nutrient uptake outer membrane protein [Psychroflexus sp. CAK8W]|uniref:RagB/SusD family nutrient uptake outer membrane protein n=1 Tax=Psychroflexus longus TaxID=2873596 RepID=A0ABS7XI65_9FLAO|nr:RagB/SusD family nutrient uptake outer membrane protein [Psychroflexus longus]MBZ9777591.1 RagB/SusD family nutrient uptake outer membrane protein [Psychroflexus longus]
MKTIYKLLMLPLLGLLVLSCDLEDGENLNGPTAESIQNGITRGELQQTVNGALSDMRLRLDTQIDGQALPGREYYRFQSSDPRWASDVMTGNLDDNTFYTTGPYGARYTVIKNVNLILDGIRNSLGVFEPNEVEVAEGFLKTIQAHELLMVANQQYENGMRVDVSDPDNLGPFVSYDEALTFISNLLTEASTQLSNGSSDFPFNLPEGFDIASTPAEFQKFNKALHARVEVYRSNYGPAATLLEDSFMDLSGDLQNSVYFTFSQSGLDFPNPLFFSVNQTVANARIAHPSFIEDTLTGDNRINKVVRREEALTQSDLTGIYNVFVYDNITADVDIIRNEELVLLYAEALHLSNPSEAVNAINVVRNAAGVGDYTGGNSPSELVDEILLQKRYSLFAEGGHRWIDMRRFNRLDELPNDRAQDNVFQQFPTPAAENR